MFDLGTQELIVIFIVAFLVFGPKKLPELGRTLGKGIRDLKSAMRNMQGTFEESGADLTKELKDVKNDLEDSVMKSIESNVEYKKVMKEKTPPAEEKSMPLFDGPEQSEEGKEDEGAKGADKETDKDG